MGISTVNATAFGGRRACLKAWAHGAQGLVMLKCTAKVRQLCLPSSVSAVNVSYCSDQVPAMWGMHACGRKCIGLRGISRNEGDGGLHMNNAFP